MLNLLTWEDDGPLVQFWYGDESLGERPWSHTAVRELLASWVRELEALARLRGRELGAAEVVAAVCGLAKSAEVVPALVDWLGLALYAERRRREVSMGLFGEVSQATQAEHAAAVVLASRLEGIHSSFLTAADAQLKAMSHAA